jgi:hypothetical protein
VKVKSIVIIVIVTYCLSFISLGLIQGFLSADIAMASVLIVCSFILLYGVLVEIRTPCSPEEKKEKEMREFRWEENRRINRTNKRRYTWDGFPKS